MLQWVMYWVWWASWRAAITLACLLTMQHYLHLEGYRVDNPTLIVVAIVFIVGVRVWAPAQESHRE
jgi:hypothetical protein